MNLPSIKTLTRIAGERAKELRTLLEVSTRTELEALLESGKYPRTAAWYRLASIKHAMTIKLSIADEILGTHGVEYVAAGKGQRSPAIDYRCLKCVKRGQINAVACYKSQCTRPQTTETCPWCWSASRRTLAVSK